MSPATSSAASPVAGQIESPECEFGDSLEVFMGTRIRGARISRGLTIKELSLQTKISSEQLSLLELGAVRAQADELIALAHALNTQISYFYLPPPRLDSSNQ
jgi:transcriptional regulator with XRE-family HTH domain